ncbi:MULTISPECIES: XRE family transcriptional regulator [unclassified Streptomyces]|uniref:helix-turn-helix domain-containing protein n=1 Tax=unclassified Streptomyces TaxID=2593676 RepID=UPI00081E8953|nr:MULTISPECIES: XRE family transcriptional regulator [unclassified Streptomyces]MYR28145.1 helix-turn-helix domain-containing protein [Streptomyces sp. SID4945]SCD45099.1 transcriptional regulator, XRE family with cupin sensor [Streptomyces sp. TverLS-915]SCF34462.1 transcriptional regulator, XRE family with cupin sensor [Streptomyces sp. LcepLS]
MADLAALTRTLARNVRHWRTERGHTLDALAARAGVSRGMIVQIEQARTNPSLGTVVKVADALGVSIPTLLDQVPGPRVRIVPEEDAVVLWRTGAGSSGVLRAGTEAPGPLELWTWRLAPGEEHSSEAHPAGTRELLHVTAGELTLVVGEESHRVPTGSGAVFAADAPHAYRNEGATVTEATMAVSVPYEKPGG